MSLATRSNASSTLLNAPQYAGLNRGYSLRR
jgi:hypothetical protein